MRKLSLFLAIAIVLSGSSAVAATKSPSPTATTKATTKASSKPTAKPTSTVKPTASTKPTSTAKTTAKPTSTKKSTSSPASTSKSTSTSKPVVKPKPRPRPRRSIDISPSPRPAWPPAGFKPESGIYAKVPTSKELIGVLSAKGSLATQIAACKEFVCGAVQVAAEQGCLWWEIDSKVYAANKDLIGNLQTVTGGSTYREIKTILLISPEKLETNEYIDSIEVACHQDIRPDTLQPMTFTKVNS